ncbi:protein transport protein sec61 gamma subunit,putative [Trypanosoma brucei gambiense DAL972]|uniref:Protein transport protein Sec61 gamma subunit, putative n=3 Tax=Trypanosoma brucei TaxID=5691 RepID=Q57WX9_TRYB2|nr:protein transport protein sec61 gamma subunit,putative [Trypanosoma brucei gambiense DAL972]XP_843692.1 protein transport protein Sec61 gamma subunit, putative [Trypanosoma brucei brucei TREU927]AAX69889.1 protein transport protein Sec61 gamma subunit, putative [Trypanosoma brucei]RHW73458.1 protein transport protein Sec61 gamma subunit [Trypanosoma brucei equiperdum]AAZ10133.1 protein transport protein Sec61 gamma subunit, putative [Trypanosoma brucei brucei TREU927]CBH09725.1 protein tran|eukprot:XP_011772018.1 protein transport protein sec61 gamma subunit,putative [Trypanosoma brucei gambiense DAL972]
MDFLDETVIHPMTAFARNSRMLVRKCQKPNYSEFNASAMATLVGFVVMGLLGFFVKVVFIPINNVVLGA